MKYSIPSTAEIASIVASVDSAMRFLLEKGVVQSNPPCFRCGGPTSLRLKEKVIRCTRLSCRVSRSCMHGTFFSRHKAPPNRILEAAYHWLGKASNKQIETYTTLSNVTVSGLVSYFRDLVADSLNDVDMQIGGPGVVVEVDETKMGKRKYHKGHRVDGVWVLVGVERTAERKLFLRILPDRTATTLEQFILQHVTNGTTIVTDCWRGYNSLESLGYVHLTVNHSKTFKNPVTGACTNTVEGTNCALKASIPPRNRTADCGNNLWEFIWRRKNNDRLWEAFIEALCEVVYE